jgi:uncharacterized MAPEG superfamily protein
MYALHVLVYMSILTWLSFLIASALRVHIWTPSGLQLAFGNRDNLPPPTIAAGRAERMSRNTLENFVLFSALVLAAHAGGVAAERVDLGAQLFFWARVAYIPVYLAGIIYLRTLLWLISVVGLALIASVML